MVPKLEKKRENPINIYLHEKDLECLCRALLLLTVICETQLSQRERMELFLDLYANSMIRERTNAYLQSIVQDLIQLITEDGRCSNALKELVSFECLKFKERDEMEDVVSSYHDAHSFDIEKARDTRLRALFKDRYDFRRNLTDWDYQFGGLKKNCPYINVRDYKDWRLTGLAFELRLAANSVPNRSMGSYVPG
jgi:dynein assembly factor 3